MRIIVLLNLKPGKVEADYLEWARGTDLPTVNSLESVAHFQVLKATSLLGSDEKPPYQYIEVLDVANMEMFGEETSTEAMHKIAAEFNEWANPTFILTEDVGARS
ncbi:REDY-like protein HapK [Hyphomonas sp.]|uniref:REDY-like protein HapK n=1 Tax=Hyphomonas sp. TaxID=87 RepID=UPI0030F6BCC3